MQLLETKRLKLRRFETLDAQHLFELDNDAEVMRFINGGVAAPMSVIKERILPTFMTYNEQNPEFGFWAVIYKETQAFTGWLSFRLLDAEPRVVSLGYRFHKRFWGQGFATEGSMALLNLGFTKLGVTRVVATTYEENIASQRVLKKLGMTLNQRFRLSQEDLVKTDTSYSEAAEVWEGDDFEYVLTKSAWE